jgi:hypothetical protein
MIHTVIDRLLHRGTRARLALPDLTYQLCRRVEALRWALHDRTVLPVSVVIRCSRHDFDTVAAAGGRLAGTLAGHMCRYADARGWFVVDVPRVRFMADRAAADGAPLIEAMYPAPTGPEPDDGFWALVAGAWEEPPRVARAESMREHPAGRRRLACRPVTPTPMPGPRSGR